MLKPIVIVEDNPNDLELTLVALDKARLANELIILRDGAEAIDYLCYAGKWESRERGNPAVILLDLKLPKRTGLEVLERIKTDPELRKIPVVMLTGSREEVDLERSYGLGVNAYVVKPVNFQDFVTAVQDLGGFWAVLNETPPGCVRPMAGNGSKR
ncbi:MAG TPA: response regulator [Bryobacteraceae bacterium]|jgi:CheY-like chemotaxis protein|nr:response regulator [Bryobacteraceae bacterium]